MRPRRCRAAGRHPCNNSPRIQSAVNRRQVSPVPEGGCSTASFTPRHLLPRRRVLPRWRPSRLTTTRGEPSVARRDRSWLRWCKGCATAARLGIPAAVGHRQAAAAPPSCASFHSTSAGSSRVIGVPGAADMNFPGDDRTKSRGNHRTRPRLRQGEPATTCQGHAKAHGWRECSLGSGLPQRGRSDRHARRSLKPPSPYAARRSRRRSSPARRGWPWCARRAGARGGGCPSWSG